MQHAVLNPGIAQRILEEMKPDGMGRQFIIVQGASFRRALDPYRVEMVN